MTILHEATHWHKKKLGTWPNLDNPKTFNEKIAWLKVYDQDRDQITCCDKLAVKDFIAKDFGTDLIIPATTEYPMVIKPNNGSGGVRFANNKQEEIEAEEFCRQKASKPYGKGKGEWAYRLIKPGVVKEQKLEGTGVDYKFNCVHGEVKWVTMTWDRHGGKKKESILDPNGNTTPLHLVHTMKHVEQEPFDGLENFFEMKKIAEKISARWKYIRVDLYWEGQPKLGELTFWPGGGCYKTPDNLKFGELLDINLTTTKEPVIA